MVVRCTGTLYHASRVGGRRIVASNAGSRHGAMVHSFHGKRRCAAVALGALIAGHTGRSNGRNVVGWLRHDIGVSTAMAGLARSADYAGMVVGRRQPV